MANTVSAGRGSETRGCAGRTGRGVRGERGSAGWLRLSALSGSPGPIGAVGTESTGLWLRGSCVSSGVESPKLIPNSKQSCQPRSLAAEGLGSLSPVRGSLQGAEGSRRSPRLCSGCSGACGLILLWHWAARCRGAGGTKVCIPWALPTAHLLLLGAAGSVSAAVARPFLLSEVGTKVSFQPWHLLQSLVSVWAWREMLDGLCLFVKIP